MRIGSVVKYSPFGGGVRTVVVTNLDENNGRPAFSGVLMDETRKPVLDEMTGEPAEVWGYRSQAFYVEY